VDSPRQDAERKCRTRSLRLGRTSSARGSDGTTRARANKPAQQALRPSLLLIPRSLDPLIP